MVQTQGEAGAWTRSGKILIVAESTLGGWQDEHGDWRGASMTDFEAYHRVSSSDASDENIGASLREAMLSSRLHMTEEWRCEQHAIPFEMRLASGFGLKPTRNLYSGMKLCHATWRQDAVVFLPTRRRRGGAWTGFPKDSGHDDVTVSFSASDAELGAALRLCLSRCL